MAKKKNKMHIFLDSAPNVIVDKASAEKVVNEKRKIDSQKVKGRFVNMMEPGKKVRLPYLKYRGDPLLVKTFEHGQEYEIPKGWADQINGIGHDGYTKITYRPTTAAPARTMDEMKALEPTPIVQPLYNFVTAG